MHVIEHNARLFVLVPEGIILLSFRTPADLALFNLRIRAATSHEQRKVLVAAAAEEIFPYALPVQKEPIMADDIICGSCGESNVTQPGQAADAWYFLTSNPSVVWCSLRCLAIAVCGKPIIRYLEDLHLEDVESVAEIQAERYAVSFKPCGTTPGMDLEAVEWHLVGGAA